MSVMDLYNTVVLSNRFRIKALKGHGHMCNDFVEFHGFVTVGITVLRGHGLTEICQICDFLIY